VLKLSKLLRVFRTIRFLDELKHMVSSIFQSGMMLIWAMALLFIISWTLALIFLQGLSARLQLPDVDPEMEAKILLRFGTLFQSICTLFCISAGGVVNWLEVYDIVIYAGDVYGVILVIYIAFWIFSIQNILTGIVVECVVSNAEMNDHDRMVRFRRRKIQQAEDLKKLFARINVSRSGAISEAEFVDAMADAEILFMMEESEVNPRDARTIFRILRSWSPTEKTVKIEAFVDAFMQMRGSAAGIDVQILRVQLETLLRQFHRQKKEAVQLARRKSIE
jgi:ABC-type multidrug transport system fused ATPase/permease subunit